MSDFLIQTTLSFIWTWNYVTLLLFVIQTLILYLVANAKWAQIHMDQILQ